MSTSRNPSELLSSITSESRPQIERAANHILKILVLLLLPFTTAFATWSTVPTTNTLVATDANGPAPCIVNAEDITGGVIVVTMHNGVLIAQRYDKLGVSMWGPVTVVSYPNVLSVTAVSDRSGGVEVAVMLQAATTRPIYSQHISASGVALWNGTAGTLVTVGTGANFNGGGSIYPSIAADPYGGCVIAWAGYLSGYPITTKKILAAHVPASGAAPATVPVCATPAHDKFNAQIVSTYNLATGEDAYVVVWEDSRNTLRDIYAQKLSSNLVRVWTSSDGGVPVCTALGQQLRPQVIYRYNASWDRGAYVIWEDQRASTSEIYGQLLDDNAANGAPLWPANGELLCAVASDKMFPAIAMAEQPARDLFVAWQDSRGGGWKRYAQRVHADGTLAWGGSAALVSAAQGSTGVLDPQPVTIVAADEGAVVTWATYNSSSSTSAMDLYAQRMNPDGTTAWGANGMPLSVTTSGNQFLGKSVLLPDVTGCNRMIVTVWLDDRGHVNNGVDDSYIQAMRWTDGSLGGGIVPGFPDVWIQRNGTDFGNEPLAYTPGNWTSEPWNSPDVWNTVSTSTVDHTTSLVHENPNNAAGHTNVLRVRLHNRGCGSESGRLMVYISNLNATAPWTYVVPAGNSGPTDPGLAVPAIGAQWTRITPGAIVTPPIAPGSTWIQNISWTPPAAGHYCFYVRFESDNDPIHSEGPWVLGNVIDNNNLAHRNVDVVHVLSPHGVFVLNNIDKISRSVDLQFHLAKDAGSPTTMTSLGASLTLPAPSFLTWKRAGAHGTGIRINKDSSIQLVSDTTASITGIPMQALESGTISYKFDSLDNIGDEHLQLQIAHFTQRGDSTVHPDDGLTLDIQPEPIIPTGSKGSDTVAEFTADPPRTDYVHTYMIYVASNNGLPGLRGCIDRVIVGLQGATQLLAAGPLQYSQHATLSLAHRDGRDYVFHCDQSDQVQLYAGEVFRPVYLTIASQDTSPVAINFATIDVNGDTLTTGTAVLSQRLASGQTSAVSRPTIIANSRLTTYPNPVSNATTIRFELPESVPSADLIVNDAVGHQVRSILTSTPLAAGPHEMTFDASTLSSGTYYLTLKTADIQYTSAIRVIH